MVKNNFQKGSVKVSTIATMAILAAIVTVASVTMVIKYYKTPNTAVSAPAITPEADKGLDSDNDGLPDTIEKILGTSISNADTDADGYSDLQEIKNGYSPLIAGTAGKYASEEWDNLKRQIKTENENFYKKEIEAITASQSPDFNPSVSLAPTLIPISESTPNPTLNPDVTPSLFVSPAPTPTPTLTPMPTPTPFADITSPIIIPVLDLSYIPTMNGRVDITKTGDWQNTNINALVNNIDDLRYGLINTLETGSIYHGYKDYSATPSLNYEIYENKTFYSAVPISSVFWGMGAHSADHLEILNDLNICDYVENKGVKEVWIWMYHTQEVGPIESNMAGPYGDISNSNRVNDLPVCSKTYTVYDYNYGRSYSMAVEDHTHQIEAILNYVDNNLFWNLFVGTNNGGGRCGWTHYPPNGLQDYDWNNENTVLSDCEDWKPDRSGQEKSINCRTWSINPYSCNADEGLSFKKWWMQNIPGKNNNLFYNNKKLKNWWIFIGDFDKAIQSKNLAY